MQLSLIVAYAQNNVIGRDNTLPWKLPSDLAHFKRTTLGHPVIMGRKTWESLGRPLPGRRNIVISSNPHYAAPGAQCVTSLTRAIEAIQDVEQAFVIGGAQIYQEALPLAQQVIATEVQAHIEGDAFFAPLDKKHWIEISRISHPPENGLSFDIVQYVTLSSKGMSEK
jgi:dihydrofolate reductase